MSDAAGGTEREAGTGGEVPEAHASDRTYVGVAAVLAVLTAMEVAVFYIPAVGPALVPILVVLMLAKFALVALFFMHLRFDSPVFSGIFLGPLLVSVAVLLALLALYGAFPEAAGG